MDSDSAKACTTADSWRRWVVEHGRVLDVAGLVVAGRGLVLGDGGLDRPVPLLDLETRAGSVFCSEGFSRLNTSIAPSTLAWKTMKSVFEYRSSSPVILAVAASLIEVGGAAGHRHRVVGGGGDQRLQLLLVLDQLAAEWGRAGEGVVGPHDLFDPVEALESGRVGHRIVDPAVDAGVEGAPDLGHRLDALVVDPGLRVELLGRVWLPAVMASHIAWVELTSVAAFWLMYVPYCATALDSTELDFQSWPSTSRSR